MPNFERSQIDALPQRYRANLINGLSGFKSAVLIGTRSLEGKPNLAIISSVFHVGANPPLVGFLMRPHTVVRDTLQNLKDTSQCTINHVHRDFFVEAHQCSARFDPDISEFEACGLTEQQTAISQAPYVNESVIKYALRIQSIQRLELNGTELVIGEITELCCPNEVIGEDGFVDIESAGTVAISGLDGYHSTTRLARLSYARPDVFPSKID